MTGTEVRSNTMPGMGWTLSLVHSPEPERRTRTLRLEDPVIHVQRTDDGRGSSLILRDAAASQDCVRLSRSDDGSWELLDRGSRNPVRVNGQARRRIRLEANDVLRIGDSLLIVDRDAPDPARRMDPLRRARVRELREALTLHESASTTLFVLEASLLGLEQGMVLLWSPHAFESLQCGRWIAEGWDLPLTSIYGADESAAQRIGDLPANEALILDRLDFVAPEQLGAVESALHRRMSGLTSTLNILTLPADMRRDVPPHFERLLSRIGHFELAIPPLRRRRRDVMGALTTLRSTEGRPARLAPNTLEHLVNYDWPGELAELRRVLRRLQGLLDQGHVITPALLPLEMRESVRISAEHGGMELNETNLAEAFREHEGNMTAIADSFGYSRTYFYRLLRQLKIDVRSLRGGWLAERDE